MTSSLRLPISLTLGLLVLTLRVGSSLAAPPTPDRTEEQALELAVTISVEEDPDARIAAVRKLADYRYPGVAFALVQLLESPHPDPAFLREVEWALAAMSGLAVEPLANAVDEGRVPTDSAVLVLTRIARQDLSFVAPVLTRNGPDSPRCAALGLALSRHPEAPDLLARAFPEASPAGRAAVVDVACSLDLANCRALLGKGLDDADPLVRLTALSAVAAREERTLLSRVAPLLHTDNLLVVRAALEAVAALGPETLVGDLEILLQATSTDVQLQILHLLAGIPGPEARRVLTEAASRYSPRTEVGRAVRELLRAAPPEPVVTGDAASAVPVSAVLAADGEGAFRLILHAESGARVVVRGALYIQCKRAPLTRVNVGTGDFASDGTLPVQVRCRRGGPPEVHWKRRDGVRLRAEHQ